MAEGRMLKRAISDSRRLSELKTDSARLLWTWILPYLDIEGRYFADPDLIKGKIVPRIKTFNSKNITEYLKDMADVGLIILFESDGDKYLEFRNFKEFQRLNPDREAKSQIPNPELIQSIPELVQSTLLEDKLREDKLKLSEIEDNIIGDLNFVLGTAYKTGISKTCELIKSRLKEGFTIDDFKTVHRKQLRIWGADSKMCKFLRPITLYGTKFESYLNSKEPVTALTESGIQAYLVGQSWLKKHEAENVR